MSSIPDHEAIYKKLHAQREEHIEQARRARDMQVRLAEMEAEKYENQVFALLKRIWGGKTTR